MHPPHIDFSFQQNEIKKNRISVSVDFVRGIISNRSNHFEKDSNSNKR